MSDAKHSPGPWTLEMESHKASYQWYDAAIGVGSPTQGTYRTIARIPQAEHPYDDEENARVEADARLIAASPLLLAALEKVQAAADHELECDFCWHADDCEILLQLVADAGVAREDALRAARGAEADDDGGDDGH